MRIYAYAKTVNVESKDVLAKALELGFDVSTVSSNITPEQIRQLEPHFRKEEGYVQPQVEEPKKEAAPAMSLKLEKTYPLEVQLNTGKHWIVVGCGGNGGYFIPQLLRQIALQNKRLELAGRTPHRVTLIDADVVEDKNLTRQNFVRNDVGRNKAQIMAERYGRAFGLPVDFLPEYIQSGEQLKRIVHQNMKPVFVGAVDNNKTRMLINEAFESIKNSFWIDAGNEEWGGQVVCGFNNDNIPPNPANRKPHMFHLPSVVQLYPEVAQATDKLPTELSCAERAVSNPQNIFTNMTAANLLMGFANTILTANGAEGEGLKQNAIAFNAQSMSFTTRLNTLSNLTPQVAKATV